MSIDKDYKRSVDDWDSPESGAAFAKPQSSPGPLPPIRAWYDAFWHPLYVEKTNQTSIEEFRFPTSWPARWEAADGRSFIPGWGVAIMLPARHPGQAVWNTIQEAHARFAQGVKTPRIEEFHKASLTIAILILPSRLRGFA